MATADNAYYIPHGTRWPIMGSIALTCIVGGFASYLNGGSLGNEVGRLGHGLGMQLTEQPSNTRDDHTPLEPGMVMTLEPGMTFAPGRQMVHEENIVITEGGADWLTSRASPDLPVL